MKIEIPEFSLETLRTEDGLWIKADSVSDLMLECSLANPSHQTMFIYLARVFAGKQPRNAAKPDYGTDYEKTACADKATQAVESVVPEAGIEPATKGL